MFFKNFVMFFMVFVFLTGCSESNSEEVTKKPKDPNYIYLECLNPSDNIAEVKRDFYFLDKVNEMVTHDRINLVDDYFNLYVDKDGNTIGKVNSIPYNYSESESSYTWSGRKKVTLDRASLKISWYEGQTVNLDCDILTDKEEYDKSIKDNLSRWIKYVEKKKGKRKI